LVAFGPHRSRQRTVQHDVQGIIGPPFLDERGARRLTTDRTDVGHPVDDPGIDVVAFHEHVVRLHDRLVRHVELAVRCVELESVLLLQLPGRDRQTVLEPNHIPGRMAEIDHASIFDERAAVHGVHHRDRQVADGLRAAVSHRRGVLNPLRFEPETDLVIRDHMGARGARDVFGRGIGGRLRPSGYRDARAFRREAARDGESQSARRRGDERARAFELEVHRGSLNGGGPCPRPAKS